MELDIVLQSFQDLDTTDVKMPIIAVYDKPLDYPDKFVARFYDLNRPSHMIMLADSLEDIRMYKPAGMAILPRTEYDDKKIVEAWL